MARGWESKAVEAQIEDATLPGENAVSARPSPRQIELRRRREGLLLTRQRVLNDLEKAKHPRHRQMLQEALAHLDGELAGLIAVRQA